jgi:hypothetical protein
MEALFSEVDSGAQGPRLHRPSGPEKGAKSNDTPNASDNRMAFLF